MGGQLYLNMRKNLKKTNTIISDSFVKDQQYKEIKDENIDINKTLTALIKKIDTAMEQNKNLKKIIYILHKKQIDKMEEIKDDNHLIFKNISNSDTTSSYSDIDDSSIFDFEF